jgi:methanethiol oxidase
MNGGCPNRPVLVLQSILKRTQNHQIFVGAENSDRRVYVTNSLYTAVDDQIYPDGIKGWMMKVDVDPITSEMHVDPRFFPQFDGMRPHQTRLEGGDASSDSYCYA